MNLLLILMISVVVLLLPFAVRNISASPQEIFRDPRYPAHWWTPVPEAGKPDWEILPQEAGPGEVILSKRNELGFCSQILRPRLSSSAASAMQVWRASGR